MTYSFIRHVLQEGKPEKLEIISLPYDTGDLDPAISEDTICSITLEKLYVL
jgi:hypothetical protein